MQSKNQKKEATEGFADEKIEGAIAKPQVQVPDFRSCLMIDLGRETDGNNEICLGVRFCLVHN